MPFWRAWFGLFFIASLFKKINNYSKKNGYNKNTYPVFFVILYILITVIAILSESIFVWLFMIILSPFIFLTTINASNYYYNKIEKNHLERPWKWRCLVLLLLCLLGWILIFL
jgi:glucan phosphoethanolaminetransferase (alkaline phosphatase superfamily)